MAKVILLVIAGIVALNVALLVGAALVAVLDRRRRKRDIRDLEHLWHLAPRRPVAAGRARMDAPSRPPAAVHPLMGGTLLPARSPARSSGGRRVIGVTLVAAVAFVGTASASPQARHAVTTVLDSVTTSLGLSGEDASSERADGMGPAVVSAPSQTMPRDLRSASAGTGGRPGGSGNASSSTSPGGGSSSGEGTTITDPGVAPLDATTATATPASSSAVTVQWNDISGESGYRVERSTDGIGGWSTAATPARNETTATDPGLAANTTYYYRVIATTDAGDASVSDVISTTTLLDPPASPELLAVPSTSTSIDLSWSNVATATGYRIEMSLDGGLTWNAWGTQGADVTTFSDGGLAPATTYWYRVIAINAAGESAPSGVQSATTLADPTGPSDPPTTAA